MQEERANSNIDVFSGSFLRSLFLRMKARAQSTHCLIYKNLSVFFFFPLINCLVLCSKRIHRFFFFHF